MQKSPVFGVSEIEELIKEHLPDASVRISDMTGGGDHWELEVRSQAFKNKSLVEQHRLIYSALGEALTGPIHAVKIKTIPID